MVLATRVLVAISAQSVATVEDQVTLPQLRALVIIVSRGPQNLRSVAQALGVHPSNATRICDKLVEEGLLHRSDNPANRRQLVLQLTEPGRHLIDTMTEHRRTAIANILAKMPTRHRADLVSALLAFAEAAEEIPESQEWRLGWTTGQPHDTIANTGEPHPHPCRTECGHQSG
ncbi:MAG: MarR family transcriptional regulator [Pseudonocardia sp.]|nr:MarR family transcriptional regulator [Pseudonocardia sp.]